MMIRHYLKVAIRNIMRYKMQNFISIVGLAVGILCFTICMYCSRFVNTINHSFPNCEHIVEVSLHNEQTHERFSGTPVPLSEELRIRSVGETIACMTYARERSYSVELSEDKLLPYELETIEVDTFYNKVFTPKILAGEWEIVSHMPNSVIISRSTATKIFGNIEKAVGKRLISTKRLNTSPETTPKTGGIVYTIRAVMEDIPLNNGFNFMHHIDMLTVNDSEGLFQSPKRYNMTGSRTYILLSPYTSIADLEEQLYKQKYTYTLYGQPYVVAADAITSLQQMEEVFILGLITGIVGTLILLVGLINFFHFLIGSFFNRIKEYSIMKVAGSSWRQLFCLLFVQSVLIVFAAVFLVMCGIELIGSKMDFSISSVIMIFSPQLLLVHVMQYIVFLIMLCAIICFIVSVHIRRISVQTGIYGGNRRRGKQWGRNTMLGFQFFICWIFVALTVGLFLQSEETSKTLFHTLSQNEKAVILSIPLDYSFMKNEEKLAMVERFSQHAGVKDILLSDIAYTNGVSGNLLMTEKGNDNSWVDIDIIRVPLNFFSFMNIPIEQGRAIQNKKDIVIDKIWRNKQKKNVIGMNFYDHATDYTVSGVCTPFQTDVHTPSGGYAFTLFEPSVYVGHCYVKCYPEQQTEVVKWIEKVRREVLPESIPCQVRTFLDDIHEVQALEYFLKDIILFFAIVSVIITLLGVYSSITLDTEYRQKEVAIRKVNGAEIHHIIWLFARLYITLLVVTAAITFPLIYMILQMWRQMYTVFFHCGFWFWAGIFVFVAVITTLTIWFRIIKVSRINLAVAIKNE